MFLYKIQKEDEKIERLAREGAKRIENEQKKRMTIFFEKVHPVIARKIREAPNVNEAEAIFDLGIRLYYAVNQSHPTFWTVKKLLEELGIEAEVKKQILAPLYVDAPTV